MVQKPILVAAAALIASMAAAPLSRAFASVQIPTTVTSNRWFPLAGFGQGVGGESVVLAGRVHVQTRVFFPRNPGEQLRVEVHTNLATVSGVGAVTGTRYAGVGTASHYGVVAAGPPALDPFTHSYSLKPAPPPPSGPVPIPYPLTLFHSVSFDEFGNLTGGFVEVYNP